MTRSPLETARDVEALRFAALLLRGMGPRHAPRDALDGAADRLRAMAARLCEHPRLAPDGHCLHCDAEVPQ